MTGYQCKTLRAIAATAYRITFAQSKTFVAVEAKVGTFWIKANPPGATLVAATAALAIPGAGLQTDYAELTDGDTISFGSSGPDGVRRVDGSMGSILTIDVWCEVGGDIICVTQ